jgi:hypothetical protein
MNNARTTTVEILHPPWANLPIVFLTRDSDDATGVPGTDIDVWTIAPIRSRALNGLGAIWMPAIGGVIVARLPIAAAAKAFLTLPDNDREVVRYGA